MTRSITLYFNLLAAFFLFSPAVYALDLPVTFSTPFVSHLDAVVNGTEVVLNWNDPTYLQNSVYEVWSSTENIDSTSFHKANRLGVVAPGVESFTDRAPREENLWYAVTSFSAGKRQELFIPYRNVTVSPVNIRSVGTHKLDQDKMKNGSRTAFSPETFLKEEEQNMRRAPLPTLRITEALRDGSLLPVSSITFPRREPLSDTARESLAAIMTTTEGTLWIPPQPELLSIDKSNSGTLHQIELKKILDGPFADENWDQALGELQKMAANKNLDSGIHTRIQFYVGECEYYLGRLKRAFLSFLIASENYYQESNRWINRIFNDITPLSPPAM